MSLTTGTKIVLIGAGDVGVAYAYALVNQGLCDHLAIIDINERKTWGHVQDLNHAVPWAVIPSMFPWVLTKIVRTPPLSSTAPE